MYDIFSVLTQTNGVHQKPGTKKIGFVIPWYGPEIPGGAERACKELAENLAARGLSVEILTTCAKDFYSWENYYDEGVDLINNIPVRRFLVRERNPGLFDQLNAKILQGGELSFLEEYQFINEIINSNQLSHYITEHRKEYLFFFTPYMFGTSYWGSLICPESSYLLPCCHEEGYLHLSIYKHIFEQVKNIFFYSEPEQTLAAKYFKLNHASKVLGLGVSEPPPFEKGIFIKKFGISGKYILSVGRKQPEKNTPVLIDYFQQYLQHNQRDLKLVFIGNGQLPGYALDNKNIIDIGYISEEEKYDAMENSVCLCQPSSKESFSYVIMEAWMMKKPVIVNEECDVTVHHCRKSNGGLFFANYDEFENCLNYIFSNKDLSDRMGRNGFEYLQKNLTWPLIIDRFLQFVDVSSSI